MVTCIQGDQDSSWGHLRTVSCDTAGGYGDAVTHSPARALTDGLSTMRSLVYDAALHCAITTLPPYPARDTKAEVLP